MLCFAFKARVKPNLMFHIPFVYYPSLFLVMEPALKLKLYLASASAVLGPLAFTMQASHNEKVQLFELPVCCGMFILGTPVSHGLIESCENIE